MGDHLKETGKALVQDPERQKEPVEWVQRLLQVGAGGAPRVWSGAGGGGGGG